MLRQTRLRIRKAPANEKLRIRIVLGCAEGQSGNRLPITKDHDIATLLGFYPEITDGCERVENFRSCFACLRRILELWNRSMYSNTSALTAPSVGYFMRYGRAGDRCRLGGHGVSACSHRSSRWPIPADSGTSTEPETHRGNVRSPDTSG